MKPCLTRHEYGRERWNLTVAARSLRFGYMMVPAHEVEQLAQGADERGRGLSVRSDPLRVRQKDAR